MKKGLILFLTFVLLGSGCTQSEIQQNNLIKTTEPAGQIQQDLIDDFLDKSIDETATETTPSKKPEPVFITPITPTPTYTPPTYTAPPVKSCCKICSKGKACGDSCISRSYTCHKGPGCACDG